MERYWEELKEGKHDKVRKNVFSKKGEILDTLLKDSLLSTAVKGEERNFSATAVGRTPLMTASAPPPDTHTMVPRLALSLRHSFRQRVCAKNLS